GIEIVVAVPGHIGGFDGLSRPTARAISHRAQHGAIAIQFQQLTVLAAGHPEVSVTVETNGAHQIAHLDGAAENTALGVNHQAILFTVADPDVAILRVYGHAVRHAELALADAVAEPLIDELAGPVQVDDAGRTDIAGRISGIGIVRAFIGMAFRDEHIAFAREGDHHGLPQEPLALGFIPVAAAIFDADDLHDFAVGI